jgi:hypothetical protein
MYYKVLAFLRRVLLGQKGVYFMFTHITSDGVKNRREWVCL